MTCPALFLLQQYETTAVIGGFIQGRTADKLFILRGFAFFLDISRTKAYLFDSPYKPKTITQYIRV